jgi:hypothetical protein
MYKQLIWPQTVLERNRTSTWRRRLSELRDALGGCERVNLVMRSEAVICANLEAVII